MLHVKLEKCSSHHHHTDTYIHTSSSNLCSEEERPTAKDSNLGIFPKMARTHTTTQNDLDHLLGQAAMEKEWKIVVALFDRDIEFNETALQSVLLEAFKQRKKSILYGIMYSPFINLEKCVLYGIENSDENFVNYIFRHYDDFHVDFIINSFKSVVQNHQLRAVKLLISFSRDTNYFIDIQTILEAREMLKVSQDVAQAKNVQDMCSLLNQRLDSQASEIGQRVSELNGQVQVAELCHTSCPISSCPRYHTLTNFHWQISLGGSYWLNIPENLVSCLENGYCDPSRDGIALPRLDPSKPLHAELICVLGREVWKAEFTNNCIKLKNANSSKSIYLRRLYKDIPILWYYQEDNGIWEEYTNNLTSDLLENMQMQNQNKINFQINGHNYEICFNSMTQRNLVSGKIRNIKRRPRRVDHSNSEDIELHELLPHTWDDMATSEVVKRVELDPLSVEYKEVYNRIGDNQMVKNYTVTIERIQNPYLWRTFQNRLQEMKEQSCNPVVLKLFHCTSKQSLEVICQENIDYRMYVNRNSYGTHFYQTVAHAEMNSRNLAFICPVFILSQVIVGSPVITFDPKITRPPISEVTNLPFDTAVDHIGKPNLYVKYEAQEYYPEYLIQYNFQPQAQ